MNTALLLSDLLKRGVDIAVDGDRVRCRAPSGILTPELREELAEKKQEILAILRAQEPASESARPSTSGESKADPVLDDGAVREIREENKGVTWFKGADGKIYRHFPGLDQSFPMEVVRPGDPAICINCGKSYRWLPFPALANVCRDCQPPSLGWIPDPGKPRFEGDLEFRSGPACRACGTAERYRTFRDGPWVCPTCHPFERNDTEAPIPYEVWSAFGALLGMTILRKERAVKEPDVSPADGEQHD